MMLLSHGTTMGSDTSYDLAYQLISDILSQQDILLSVNSGSSIAEARVEKALPFRIREKWATIGDENRPWHIHLNMKEVVQARFVKEPRSDGRQSYSIRFFDSNGNIAMRANFVKMYDDHGNLLTAKSRRYDELFTKYGKREVISFTA